MHENRDLAIAQCGRRKISAAQSRLQKDIDQVQRFAYFYNFWKRWLLQFFVSILSSKMSKARKLGLFQPYVLLRMIDVTKLKCSSHFSQSDQFNGRRGPFFNCHHVGFFGLFEQLSKDKTYMMGNLLFGNLKYYLL